MKCFFGLENFPSPLFCSGSAVLLRFFRSAGHAGRSDISPVGQVSLAAVLFRLCRSAPVLPVGRTRGAVGHFSGRAGFPRRCFVPALPFCSGSSGWQDTRGGRTFLRSGRFPSPLFCSSSAVLLRFFRSAGHAGRSKSGFEIRLRRAECFSERKTSFDYIFVY